MLIITGMATAMNCLAIGVLSTGGSVVGDGGRSVAVLCWQILLFSPAFCAKLMLLLPLAELYAVVSVHLVVHCTGGYNPCCCSANAHPARLTGNVDL